MFSNKDQSSFTDLGVSKAIGKFNEMRQVLTDQKVNMTPRTKLMAARVRYHFLCGTRAWYINEENVRKLETGRMELLRQMVNGGCSRLPTPEDAEDTEFNIAKLLNVSIDLAKKYTQAQVDQGLGLSHLWFLSTLSKNYG